MKKKKYIGQLISVKFKDRKTPVEGYVIDYNDDWTLMRYNPVDFIIDGYIIFRHKKIEGFRRGEDEKWREKVMNLKGHSPTDKDIIPITDIETILNYLTNNFGVFQLQVKAETVCYLGRLKSIDHKELVIDNLSPKGKWEGQLKLKINDIRAIEFDTDYINSLKLVQQSRRKQ